MNCNRNPVWRPGTFVAAVGEQYPKQLLALTGKETMLQATARRIDASVAGTGTQVLAPIVVGR